MKLAADIMVDLRRGLVGLFAALCLFTAHAAAAAGTPVTLRWDANTEPDLAGYIVSYGRQSGVYTTKLDVGNTTSATVSLTTPGTYYFVVSAYSPGGVSNPSAEVSTVITAYVANPLLAIDTPAPGAVTTSAFEVGGWAIDAGAPTGTGVDSIVFYVFPNDGASGGVYIGQGSYGWSRTDVGSMFGSRFTNSGFHFTITGLGPGAYLLGAYAHSTVSGTFNIVGTRHFTVSATALMSIDTPTAESTVASSTFTVGGWAIDRTIESSGLSGTGVDIVHVYAYPNPGSGTPPVFLGVATLGASRSDVGGIYGARYNLAGYNLIVNRAAAGLTPGVYNIVVYAHSRVSGSFNNLAIVRFVLQ